MITADNRYLTLPLNVAKALMQFASKDVTRFHLTGLGLCPTTGAVCATNGIVLCAVRAPDPAVIRPGFWEGAYVVQQIRLATALKGPVQLDWDKRCSEHTYPPVHQVIPEEKISGKAAIGLDTRNLSRMEDIAKACHAPKADPVVILTGHGGAMEPTRWDVRGVLHATIVVMPYVIK